MHPHSSKQGSLGFQHNSFNRFERCCVHAFDKRTVVHTDSEWAVQDTGSKAWMTNHRYLDRSDQITEALFIGEESHMT